VAISVKAAATGNWGTSPQRQQTIASSTKLSQRLKDSVAARLAAVSERPGARAVEEEAAHGHAGPSLEQFTREHKAWFQQVARITEQGSANITTLHVSTESLIGGGDRFAEAMQEVYAFLGLPKLDGPIVLPTRVIAPDKKQATKRVSKSKSYKQRREAELKRRGGNHADSHVDRSKGHMAGRRD